MDDSFSLMSLSKLHTEEKSTIGSLMIRPCYRRLEEQRFIVYSECCKLCLGFPSQTEACRFCFVVTAKPQENRKDHCGKLASSLSSCVINSVVKICSLTPHRSVTAKKERERDRGMKRDRDTVRGRVLRCLIRRIRQDGQ